VILTTLETDSQSDRVQKLKDARSEAAKEIEEYKKQKEAEFNAFEKEVSV
jgi:V-type H+-transporting ATPase subunit G